MDKENLVPIRAGNDINKEDRGHPHALSSEKNDAQDIEAERLRWQENNSSLVTQCETYRLKTVNLQREKERAEGTIQGLKQELGSANNKVGVMMVEQRELRNHWLQEKSELEGRLFQMQTVQTQYDATMRKKEKEYQRVQSHLEKQVRDSRRGQSSSITISKPLPKNLSQKNASISSGTMSTSSAASLLRDAEVAAANHTIRNLRAELSELNDRVEKVEAEKASVMNTHAQASALTEAKTYQFIQQIQTLQAQLSAAGNVVPEDVTGLSNVHNTESESSSLVGGAATPSVDSKVLHNDSVPDTPSAIEAEAVSLTASMRKRRNSGVYDANGDEVAKLREQLENTLQLVHEQDRLIHQALLGQLSGVNIDDIVGVEDGQVNALEDEALTPAGLHNATADTKRYPDLATEEKSISSSKAVSLADDFAQELKAAIPPGKASILYPRSQL
jgi:ribosomal protein S18